MSHRAALLASLTVTLVIAFTLVVGQERLFGATNHPTPEPTPLTTSSSDANVQLDAAPPPVANSWQAELRQRNEPAASSDLTEADETAGSTAVPSRTPREQDEERLNDDEGDEHEHESYEDDDDD